MICVKYFARYRELVGVNREFFDGVPENLGELCGWIMGRHPAAGKILSDERLIMAVNGVVVADRSHVLQEGDEVALFPPVTGG